MKTIGVLGGIGPQATMDFEVRLHREAQSLIPQKGNIGYPPTVVIYHRRPPVVVDSNFAPVQPLQPDPDFLAAAKSLGALADFLVITSNGGHHFRHLLEQAAGKPVLSMIELVVDEVERRRWKKVGVLGLGIPVVYIAPLEQRGLIPILAPEVMRSQLDKEIFRVMEGKDDSTSVQVVTDAIASLRTEAVDGVILGCTEIPFMLEDSNTDSKLLNPIEYLARAAVLRAIGE